MLRPEGPGRLSINALVMITLLFPAILVTLSPFIAGSRVSLLAALVAAVPFLAGIAVYGFLKGSKVPFANMIGVGATSLISIGGLTGIMADTPPILHTTPPLLITTPLGSPWGPVPHQLRGAVNDPDAPEDLISRNLAPGRARYAHLSPGECALLGERCAGTARVSLPAVIVYRTSQKRSPQKVTLRPPHHHL